MLLLLALGFGFVGLGRWILAPLFPAMLQDLQLDYDDLGYLAGSFALLSGVSSIVLGAVSHRLGRHRMLVAALLLSCAMTGLAGVAGGAVALFAIRAALGMAEGAYWPAGLATAAEFAQPRRRGLAQGLQTGVYALAGFALAPIVATQLLQLTGSWRHVLLVTALPGVLIALLLGRALREPARAAADAPAPVSAATGAVRWRGLLRSRNVLLAAAGAACAMTCLFVLGAMVPSYLIDFLKLSPARMGFIMSAIGLGGGIGALVIPWLSDLIGRRIAAVAGFLGAAAALHGFTLLGGAEPLALFALLFITSFLGVGLLALLIGPVASEAVPSAPRAGAIGLVVGMGEILAATIAPAVAGEVAQSRGIEHVFDVALAGLIAGGIASALFRETAPRRSRGTS